MSNNETLKSLAVEHDYYASGNNYYSNDAASEYPTWADFYEEFAGADIDMNLVIRWDLTKREKSDRYSMQIIIIHRRKGIYAPVHIHYVDEKDVEGIIKFMRPHFKKMLKNWQPLTNIYLNQQP